METFVKKRNPDKEIFVTYHWINLIFYFLKRNLGLGQYFGIPAVLSEELDHLKIRVHSFIQDFYRDSTNWRSDIWLLGASYNRTNKFDSEKSLKCGGDSCYRKSLDNNNICKPGMLFQVKSCLDSGKKNFMFLNQVVAYTTIKLNSVILKRGCYFFFFDWKEILVADFAVKKKLEMSWTFLTNMFAWNIFSQGELILNAWEKFRLKKIKNLLEMLIIFKI